jgi:hypothetical protein
VFAYTKAVAFAACASYVITHPGGCQAFTYCLEEAVSWESIVPGPFQAWVLSGRRQGYVTDVRPAPNCLTPTLWTNIRGNTGSEVQLSPFCSSSSRRLTTRSWFAFERPLESRQFLRVAPGFRRTAEHYRGYFDKGVTMTDHHPRRVPVLLVASLLTFLLAGCSRDTPTEPDNGPSDGIAPSAVIDEPTGRGTPPATTAAPTGDGATVEVVGYSDVDGDGFGIGTGLTFIGQLPSGYALHNTDCDDTDPAVNPAAMEMPVNGEDDDCDGLVDALDVDG